MLNILKWISLIFRIFKHAERLYEVLPYIEKVYEVLLVQIEIIKEDVKRGYKQGTEKKKNVAEKIIDDTRIAVKNEDVETVIDNAVKVMKALKVL
jgi:hypothetical protein